MEPIKISATADRYVLYFGTPRNDVDAYALASTLVALADAIREANSAINPGYHVEVVVEAFSDGSFKAHVRTLYGSAKNLFSKTAAEAIILGIISSHIYETYIKPEKPPVIIVTQDMVTIEVDDKTIIVPKTIYEAKQQVEKSTRFREAVGRMFESAEKDPNVTGLGFVDEHQSEKPPPLVPRDQFPLFRVEEALDASTREIVEVTHLEISRAILERGSRRWEFVWRGIRIAAPVLDERFYDRFFAHEIMIAPGDSLHVALRITQEKKPDLGVFVNKRYDVLEVYEHIPRMQQSAF